MQAEKETLQQQRAELDKVIESKTYEPVKVEKVLKQAPKLEQKATEEPQEEAKYEIPTPVVVEQLVDETIWHLKTSPTVELINELVKESEGSGYFKSREVRQYLALFLGIHIKLDRLQKEIKDGMGEHQSEVDKLLHFLETTKYPTDKVAEETQAKLEKVKYSLLPYGQPLLEGRERDPSLDEMRGIVDSLVAYQEEYLVPLLKDLDRTVQIRDRQVELQAEHQRDIHGVQLDCNKMQGALKGQLAYVMKLQQDALEWQPTKMNELRVDIQIKVESELLDKLIEQQRAKHHSIMTELKPTVDSTIEAYESQPYSLNYAQKLRQLQGVMAQELLGMSTTTSSEAAKVLGLTSDPVVAQVTGLPPSCSTQRQLLSQFPSVKQDALFNLFATDDSLGSYLYAQTRMWFKNTFVGNFGKEHGSDPATIDDKQTRWVACLDYAEQALNQGKLVDAVNYAASVAKDSHNQQQLRRWLDSARGRLAKEQSLKLLETYTNKIIYDSK